MYLRVGRYLFSKAFLDCPGDSHSLIDHKVESLEAGIVLHGHSWLSSQCLRVNKTIREAGTVGDVESGE